MPLRKTYRLVRKFIRGCMEDDVPSLAAATAFYAGLAFAPLVLLVLSAGRFLGPETQAELVMYFQAQFGPGAADVVESVVESAKADAERGANWQWFVSIGVLLWSGSGVFRQMQRSMNRIWNVEMRPGLGGWRFVKTWLRKRALTMVMVFSIFGLLLTAMIVSAVLHLFVPFEGATASFIAAQATTFVVATLLFGAIFKLLPDAKIAWRDVWLGAGAAAVMVNIGKIVLGSYLTRGGVTQHYTNAAGAMIALLFWVFYSCFVLYLGAELAQMVAKAKGRPVQPREYAREVRYVAES